MPELWILMLHGAIMEKLAGFDRSVGNVRGLKKPIQNILEKYPGVAENPGLVKSLLAYNQFGGASGVQGLSRAAKEQALGGR